MKELIAVLEIKDFLLNGEPRQVEFYRGQLFLTAINPRELSSSAKIGVVESGGIFEDEKEKFGPYVTLSPYYELRRDDVTGLITATRLPKNARYFEIVREGDVTRSVIVLKPATYKNSFHANAFNTVWNGNARFISESLRHLPFQGLEVLAGKIKNLDVPYNIGLEQLFEKPAERMIEAKA